MLFNPRQQKHLLPVVVCSTSLISKRVLVAGRTEVVNVMSSPLRNTPVPALIRIIWLKSSPCASCVAKLINHFRAVKRKPVIYLGRITDMECEEDKKGLVKMTKVGFRFSAWKDMQKLLQGQENTEVVAFIEELLQNYHHR